MSTLSGRDADNIALAPQRRRVQGGETGHPDDRINQA
jgi:hypothetical protein